MKKYATISRCGKYRYLLGRQWGEGSPLLFVMLNPSTADAEVDDATIRRCIGFAQRGGFGGLEVVNLFAYRATDPKDMKRAGYPVGEDNDHHIVQASMLAGAVCVAWGVNVAGLERPQIVLPMLRKHAANALQCLRITRSGYPQHPLMLASACVLQPFTADAIDAAMRGASSTSGSDSNTAAT